MTGILDSLINEKKESDSENGPDSKISHDFAVLPILCPLAQELWPTKKKKSDTIGNRPKS